MSNLRAAELITLLIGLGTIGTILWKIFDVIASLRERIKDNYHRIELLESKVKDADDKLLLGINGAQEVAQHVRTRTQSDHKDLEGRIRSVENFLQKTTDFESRQ